jgi:hypothetical protein
MSSCDQFIERAKRELPDLCTTSDLVKMGIFKSAQAASYARKKGMSSDYFKLPTGLVVHPKQGIIELLENAKHSAKGCIRENYNSGKPYTKSKSESHEKGICLRSPVGRKEKSVKLNKS